MNKEHGIAFRHAEIRMIRWVSAVKLKDKLFCVKLGQRQEVANMGSLCQVIVECYGHILRKGDNCRVNRCMNYEVECANAWIAAQVCCTPGITFL